ncbi:MAG TPA: RNA polymerase sigma factor [Solirubrobacteraceae bacterium]|nr:RNA polymerase sigma factor [Solirubrobacteraceae bacterium]
MPKNAATGTFTSPRLASVRRGPRASARRGPRGIDANLRAKFRSGDPDAVRAVYSAYGRLVYAVAHPILQERGLCEEATQQTFLKAWRAAGSIDPGRELGPWLAAIARRVAIDIYRREARRVARPLDAVSADDPALVSPAVTVEDTFELWEVRRAVSLLPDDEREVVRAQHFEGLTQSAIAARLGIPLGTVKSRSFRAHRRLAVLLGHLRPRAPIFSCPS